MTFYSICIKARRLLVARGATRELQMKDASAMHAQTGHKRIVIGYPMHAIGLSRREFALTHESRGISQPPS
ncbi:hypothetical protein CDO25_33640 (plasmid) [Sinorhizobium meliloti]|nr:hypothetical protein CDO25_33640 [Sinorhizobium meliloti]